MHAIQRYEPSRLAAIEARNMLATIIDPSEAAMFVHAAKETKDMARKISKAAKDEYEDWLTAFEWEHTWIIGMRHVGYLIAEGQEKGEITEQGDATCQADRSSLQSIGISHTQSSRWQRIASIVLLKLNEWIEEQKENGNQLTMSGALRLLQLAPDWEPLPKGTFNVIYADPPWDFANKFQRRGDTQTADAQYETMPTPDICTLPVRNVCNDETILLLWVPNALMMDDGKMVMEEWGFNYKTHIVWIKPKGPSMGWWIQNKHEPCLIGVSAKSSPPLDRPDSVIIEGVIRHSQKPDEMYEIIQRTWKPPYLELFARRKWNDLWTVWGNEAPHSHQERCCKVRNNRTER